MAAWGAGDPRWLVSDLASEGKNVNAWHWEEKQRLEWSRQRLAELLEGLAADLDSSAGQAKLTKMKSVTGEALLTTRKQNKRFAVFDLKISLAWEGEWSGGVLESPTKVCGEVSITEFASMSEHEDIDFSVSVTSSGAGTQELKQAVEALRPEIFKRLDQYAAELLDSA